MFPTCYMLASEAEQNPISCRGAASLCLAAEVALESMPLATSYQSQPTSQPFCFQPHRVSLHTSVDSCCFARIEKLHKDVALPLSLNCKIFESYFL